MFISDADLSTVLDESQMAQVIGSSTSSRKRAEDFAVEEATSYLNFNYDTKLIFGFEVFDYSNSEDYKENHIVIDSEGEGYTCIQDKTAPATLSDTSFFEVRDDRNPIIVMIVVDLLAYHLFSKVPMYKIPQHIIDRYDQAIDKLKQIRKQTMNPMLPVKVVNEDDPEDPNSVTHSITIMSNEKRNNFYD